MEDVLVMVFFGCLLLFFGKYQDVQKNGKHYRTQVGIPVKHTKK